MKKIQQKDISVIMQGMYDDELTPYCISKVRKIIPNCKLLLSTWENSNVDTNLPIDSLIINKDPGAKTRDGKMNGKMNNINRQLVSTYNGLKKANTKYALKIRTDFSMHGTGFIEKFGQFNSYNSKYRIVKERIICNMFGTRFPRGKYFNLPFHISDFSTFGLLEDLMNLYDIPLVNDEEFNWFKIHKNLKQESFAINRYNAEQSIIISFYRKNGINIQCDYYSDLSDYNEEQSNKLLVNNFYPIPFGKYGIQPLKKELLAINCIMRYTDYWTQNEWTKIYKKYCDKTYNYNKLDEERIRINIARNIEKLIILIEKKLRIRSKILLFPLKWIKRKCFPKFL